MRFPTTVTTVAALSIGAAARAAGSGDTEPPVKSETTGTCANGQIRDGTVRKCVTPEQGAMSDDALCRAAREPAQDGQHRNALEVLAVAGNRNDPRILTCKDFASRKAGRMEEGTGSLAARRIGRLDPVGREDRGASLVVIGPVGRQNLRRIAEARARAPVEGDFRPALAAPVAQH
ncbi:MAG: hypothetical protein ACK4P8_00365 [Tabrizicola sp.]